MNQSILIKRILTCAAVLTAIVVPCMTLFHEGDWLYYVIQNADMQKAWAEIVLCAVILAGAALWLPTRKGFAIACLVLVLIVAYLHSMLLPLFAAILWLTILMLSGDLLLGIMLVIILAAILSFFGVCKPLVLAAAAIPVCAAVGFLRPQTSLLRYRADVLKFLSPQAKTEHRQTIALAFVVLVIIVQIGRANNCIDYDSLWYGVRSAYVLCPDGSIFEDLGFVGMVYTYSKGFEILTLPFSLLPSYAGISAFNLLLFLLGLYESSKIGDLFCRGIGRFVATILTALVPGIVNMTLSAKPDIITWLLQIMMLRCFFESVMRGLQNEKTGRTAMLRIGCLYLVSLTMKPTAIIFSTALVGMMLLWLPVNRWLVGKEESGEPGKSKEESGEAAEQPEMLLTEEKQIPAAEQPETLSTGEMQIPAAVRERNTKWYGYADLILAALCLLIVWGRTMKLTGLPFTSVFTGLLESLGFTLKYPFAARSLPSTWQEGSQFLVAVKRLGKMLLSPNGKDMSHVLIAWGGSMFFVISLVLIVESLLQVSHRKDRDILRYRNRKYLSALFVFLPFLITCFCTLMMLYQVDGNYYMTAYSMVILLLCLSLSHGNYLKIGVILPFTRFFLALLLVFQFVIMTMTNWAGTCGFFPMQTNNGYYNHHEDYQDYLSPVDGSIYDLLSEDRKTRVVCFGEHPYCLQFPCAAESYNDITAPWGNVELVNSADALLVYLHFARIDYVYAEAEHLAKEEWSWSKGLLDEMISRGMLTDIVYEGDNWIAKVK